MQDGLDALSRRISQTDAEGRVTTWTYDALGRVASRTLPLGQTEMMVYNVVGNLIEHVDFKGQTTMHSYDVNDRLTESMYVDGMTEAFTYDALGNRTESTKTENGISSTWQYAYDSLNRLSSETQFVGTADEVTLAYQYDAAGNRTEVTETKGALTRITRYTYDALNRLQTVQDADGNTTTYTYDAVGNRSAMTHANGIQVDYVYDDLNRLTDLSHKNSGGVTLKSYAYTLLPNGKRSRIEESNGRTTDYQYDDLYRLTSEAIFDPVNASHNATYSYDKVGNRTFEEVNGVSTGYTYNDNDWLLQTGGTTYTHDANGNTESQTLDSVVTTYAYNAKNELIGSDEAGFATAYLYNVDGVRVGKGDASGQTRYTIDSNRAYAQVIAEHLDGTKIVSYVFGDDLISQKRGTETSTYHTDGLGSTRALSDSSGVLTDEYDYDAFGEVLNQTGTTENDYLFTGEQFDATLDQYYLRARYYDQSIGRFTQMDTWMGNNSDPVTLHKYLYANVDPVNNIDPAGRFTIGGFSAASNISGILSTAAVTAGRSALGRLLIGGSSNASRAGAVVLVERLGPKFFKSFAKKCKAKKNRLCQYAKGVAKAFLARQAMVSVTPNKLLSGSNRIIVVSATYDVKEGTGAAGFNGPFRSAGISKSIIKRLQAHGFTLGVKFSCLATGRTRTTGRCAEVKAANSLLRKKSKIRNIRWLKARYVNKGANGFAELGNVIDACPACSALRAA